MEIVITLASLVVFGLMVWGIARLWLRERKARKNPAPLLGVVYPRKDTEK